MAANVTGIASQLISWQVVPSSALHRQLRDNPAHLFQPVQQPRFLAVDQPNLKPGASSSPAGRADRYSTPSSSAPAGFMGIWDDPRCAVPEWRFSISAW